MNIKAQVIQDTLLPSICQINCLKNWTELRNDSGYQFSSVDQFCPNLCNPMNCNTPGLPVHHQLTEFTHTHTHRGSDAMQPSHLLASPSLSAPNLSQHQSSRKGRGTRDQIANICWIIKKAKVKKKHLFMLYWLCQSLDCVDHNKLWNILKEMGIPDQPLIVPLEKPICRSGSNS